MQPLHWLIALAWYGTGLYLVLLLIRGPLLDALHRYRLHLDDPVALLDVAGTGLGGVLLVAFFVLVDLLVRRTVEAAVHEDATPPGESNPPESGKAFPARITLLVGGWLLVISLVSTVGLFAAIVKPPWLQALLPGAREADPVFVALVMMFAAAVGGCIGTILGYLKHASIDKDFDVSYLPWYVARPIIGLMLGLIFFFLFKGSLLATVPGGVAGNLNDFGLAGLGGLIGLFSKNAVEKLRELFNTLFATQEDRDRAIYDRLPEELKPRVEPYLSLPQRPRNRQGGG